ncbi:MAG: redox-sensing transcriptional repressor Rex [Candidatus Margulisbacteria bacterium GWF2_35_9]|nr:MAG: redox-sensing transcriptional repressor Rex [Candidatus Margulisbacteria bacterium GWF2_35_9]
MKMTIPESTIHRMPQYIKVLEYLDEGKVLFVTSRDFETHIDVNPSIIRKDLSYFGEFGVRGKGYSVTGLKQELEKIMGLTGHRTIIIGAGNIGKALTNYKGFDNIKLKINAVFDNDERKIGSMINTIPVLDIKTMKAYVESENIEFVIMAVPSSIADLVVDQLIDSDIKGIINFTSKFLSVPKRIKVISINIDTKIMEMFYFLKKSRMK